MLLSDFDFELPPELIAQEAKPKGTSRMLVVEPREGEPLIEHRTIADFPSLLREGDVVVVNDTRVIPARLFAAPKGNMQRPIEVLLTRHVAPLEWETWCKPARRVREGDRLTFSHTLQATVTEKREDTIAIRFDPAGENVSAVWDEIERVGVMPLPPYIARETPRPEDRVAYQTVYADRAGAIAAPTAGLHFTPAILREVERRAQLLRVTLHVGIGTFKPVKAERIAEHQMDPEWYEIKAEVAEALNRAKAEGRRIIAIGTTTVRTLESAAKKSGGKFIAGADETSIFITPGYQFAAVDALLTNFHLPQSTLLMLVSAFAGMETIRAVYAHAIAEKYRFYSFGDCMFLSHRGSW